MIESRVMGMGGVARLVRAAVALLILAATIQAYAGPNLFAYFTILSNSAAMLLLIGQAVWPEWMKSNGAWRGAVTLYMTITGLVYAVILAPLGVDVGDYAPWANFVHHSLAPATLLIDWLLFLPSGP